MLPVKALTESTFFSKSRKRTMYIGILASHLKLLFRERCRINANVSKRQYSADQSKNKLFSWRNVETAKVVQWAKTTFRTNGVCYNDQQKGKIFPGSFWIWPMILTTITDDRQMEVLWQWMRKNLRDKLTWLPIIWIATSVWLFTMTVLRSFF